jgi:hypothetical protein
LHILIHNLLPILFHKVHLVNPTPALNETSVADKRILVECLYLHNLKGFFLELSTRMNTVFEAGLFPEELDPTINVGAMVPAFLEYYQKIWWDCRSDLPAFVATYTQNEQTVHEKQLDNILNGLVYELKHIPHTEVERHAWQLRLRPALNDFAISAFHLKPGHLAYIEANGFVDAIQYFEQMARQFDPQISAGDIFQAGRNVVTANLIQRLLGLPVRVTPSIFAYSMLYPYTDNYLDDPTVSTGTKVAFNQRFRLRLMGETVEPANASEATINTLISMIETEWDRAEFPHVYESLLSIYSAQVRSLDLVAPGVSPFERDILGISFEKGGTSVLTDGYLAAGTLTSNQARILFGFGAFTQLMDDLEDIRPDMLEKRASLFSITAPFWKLDSLSNRFFHFGHTVISDLNAFNGPDVPILSELMSTCVDPMLLNTVGQSMEFFSKNFLAQLETHLPFRFAVLNKQQKKLAHQKLDKSRLMEVFLLQ